MSAKLQHTNAPANRVNKVIETVFSCLGIKIIGQLPSLDQHILITHRYTIYGDMYFCHTTPDCAFCMNTDDFSPNYKANQIIALSSVSEEGIIEHHVADISRINSKTLEHKAEALYIMRDYYSLVDKLLNNTLSEKEKSDILLRIKGKQSDRFIVEQLLGKEIDEYVKSNGCNGVFNIYCAAHCANSAVELASTMRSKDNHS